MANYVSSNRSNYFFVKDKEAFLAECKRVGLGTWKNDDDDRLAIYPEDAEGWPSWLTDEETEEDREFDVVNFVQEHLAEGEVAILVEVGAEKLRYIVGVAHVIGNRSVQSIDLVQSALRLAQAMKPDVTGPEY